MNTAVATRPEPKAQLVAGAAVAALVPQTMEEAFRVANAIAIAGLAPKGLEKPEQILVAIMAGAELGFAPFQALQSFAVVNGKPTLWGDGLLAVVLKNGFGVKEWMENEADTYPDSMTAYCEVTRPDNGDVKVAKFSVADAKKASLWGKQGPWQSNPKRMLKMRARAFACRDGAADALKGFQMREEVEDYTPIRATVAQPSGLAARLNAPRVPATEGFTAHHQPESVTAEARFTERLDEVLESDDIPAHDVETGEIAEADDFPGDARPTLPEGLKTGAQLQAAQAAKPSQTLTLADRLQAVKDALSGATTVADFNRYWANSAALRNELDAKDPEALEEFQRFAEGRFAEIEGSANG